ncbi:hypothetical protein GOZ78_08795 [Agrobacterium vitis]|nr:hypothetical protein [Agrobacterium vitis]MVA10129.1 hypothetical protein [Agrobacterium vitis]
METMHVMQTMYLIVGLVAFAGALFGLFLMIFRKNRRRRGLLISIAASLGLALVTDTSLEYSAKEAGFKTAQDMQLANKAGITDPAEFEARRAQIEADAKAKIEAQAAERQAKADADKAEAAKRLAEKKSAEIAADARLTAEANFYAPPPAQVAFISAIDQARTDMQTANNDLAKGGVRRTRAKALCAAQKSPAVEDWSGTLEQLTTNSDGLGVVKIKIGEDAYVSTMNNAFSDMSAKTMIDPDTALFKQLAALKEGDRIRFSGRLLTNSSAVDCYWESSITLDGSMKSPEFVFRFSKVLVMP